MEYDLIHRILYSAIRNEKHFKVRRKGYIHQTFRLIYLILFKKVIPKQFNKYSISLINDAPKNIPLNINKIGLNEVSISYQRPSLKSIYLVEIFLNIAFLVRLKPLQKLLFWISERIINSLIKNIRLKSLICGHPTILMTFIGVMIKRNKGIVITAQHGIYSLGDYRVLWFEKEVATHVLVYGKYFGELYVRQGTPNYNIVIGSPYFECNWLENHETSKEVKLKNKKVLFLGQQLYKISDNVFNSYNSFIDKLISFYKAQNVEVFYKAHPRESINSSLSKKNRKELSIVNSKINIEEFDIFYSVNSSLLIELYLQKKICFQVKISIPDFHYDYFESFTGIKLVSREEIESHLETNLYEFYYDTNYINVQGPRNMARKIENILMKYKT